MECFIADFSDAGGGILSAAGRFLDELETRRLESMGSEKRRLEFAAGRLLLKYACSGAFGVPVADVGIETLPSGAIALKGRPGAYISLTHSGKFAMCAVSEAPCGVDIELMRPCDYTRILDRLALDKGESFANLPARSQREEFYALWAGREARRKLASIAPPAGRVHVSAMAVGGYMLAAASPARSELKPRRVDFSSALKILL
jgi:hypothetical protein